MQLLRRILRTLFNAFVVRGKWRIPRIIILLCLIGLTYTVGREVLCMLSSSLCEAEVTVSVGHVQLRESLGKGPPLDLVRQEVAS